MVQEPRNQQIYKSATVSAAVFSFVDDLTVGQRFTRWILFSAVKRQCGPFTLEGSIDRSLRKLRENYRIQCLDRFDGLYEFSGIRTNNRQLELFTQEEGAASEYQSAATPAMEKCDRTIVINHTIPHDPAGYKTEGGQ